MKGEQQKLIEEVRQGLTASHKEKANVTIINNENRAKQAKLSE